MGLDITYLAGKKTFSFRLSPSEIDILSLLRKKGLEDETEVIMGVTDYGIATDVQRKELSKAVKQLLKRLKDDPELLPYTYGTRIEVQRGSGMYSNGGGITSGFRIKGETYSIECGLDMCELTKKWQDEKGVIHRGAPRDVRNLKVIKLDDDNFFGDIHIYKKRKPTKLIANLKRLQQFLEKTAVSIVQKTLG
ncbi:MAG: hypothetical protein ACYSWP_18435 [Planctomycetota bacterium]|jgi:hypothetical protein